MNRNEGVHRILLVEDDPTLQELVSEFLESHGFELSIEGRGDAAVARILEENPDLVVLDLMLPGLDGVEVCRQTRALGFEGAFVMLTARGDMIDEVLGLQAGADAYLKKPVRPHILLAHIQAVLRRVQKPRRFLEEGTLRLDLNARQATIDGEPLELTTTEFELLSILAKNAGNVLSRDEISRELRGVEWDGLDRSIDVQISRLRRKLTDSGYIIKSVRGSGYLFASEA